MTRLVLVLVSIFSCSFLHAQENEKKAWQKLVKECHREVERIKKSEVTETDQKYVVAIFERRRFKGDLAGINNSLLEIQTLHFQAKSHLLLTEKCGLPKAELREKTEKLRLRNEITEKQREEVLRNVVIPAEETYPKLQGMQRRMQEAIEKAGGTIH
jgi:hypothetical protein